MYTNTSTPTDETAKLRDMLAFAYRYPQSIALNRGFRKEVAEVLGMQEPEADEEIPAGNIDEGPEFSTPDNE